MRCYLAPFRWSDGKLTAVKAWICVTCGVEFEQTKEPPPFCPICEDKRQYVGPDGQYWTTRERLCKDHCNLFQQEEPGLWSIWTSPAFAIGQRAYLLQTATGNFLWDCVTLLDDATIERVRQLGGLQAIAVSHPHYYSGMAEWSEAFGGVPIWIHARDQSWVARASPHIQYWEGASASPIEGVTLVLSGGHFDGYQVAHWPAAAGREGALFAGDQPQVCMDRRWVTFMYSYPNLIPFDASTIRQITNSLVPLRFQRLYGAFGRNILNDAKGAIARSERRYLRAIGAAHPSK